LIENSARRSNPGRVIPRRSGCQARRASNSRRPVNSLSKFNEPGPRGSQQFPRPLRSPGGATIDHHLRAFAAERQGGGRTAGRTERGRFSIRRRSLDVFCIQSWANGFLVLSLA
jgi:hypothetical protein